MPARRAPARVTCSKSCRASATVWRCTGGEPACGARAHSLLLHGSENRLGADDFKQLSEAAGVGNRMRAALVNNRPAVRHTALSPSPEPHASSLESSRNLSCRAWATAWRYTDGKLACGIYFLPSSFPPKL